MWKDIPGYECLYEVSDSGQIRSLDRVLPHPVNGLKTYYGRQLKFNESKRDAYLRVHLHKPNANRTIYLVHRLVLLSFVGRPLAGQEARHLDGNPRNNILANLSWGSKSENGFDKYDHGTMGSKSVIRSDGKLFRSLSEASRLSDVRVSDICSACKGRLKSAGGFGWSYA